MSNQFLKLRTVSLLTVLLFIGVYGVAVSGENVLCIRLDEEKAALQRLEEQLAKLESKSSLGSGDAEIDQETWRRDSVPKVTKVVLRDGEERYSVNAVQAKVREILVVLAETSGKELAIDSGISDEELNIESSFHVENAPLEEMLEIMLGVTDLEFTIEENRISVSLAARLMFTSYDEYYEQKAEHVYRRALAKFPDMEEAISAHMQLAEFYSASGAHVAAAEQFVAIADKFPRSAHAPEALYSAAEEHRLVDDVATASDLLLRITDQYYHDELAPKARLDIGDIWLGQKEYEKALTSYENALELPWSKDYMEQARCCLIRATYESGEADKALELAKKFEGGLTDPYIKTEAEYWRGLCHLAQDHYEKARKSFSDIIGRKEGEKFLSQAYAHLGEAFYKEGLLVDALEAYEGSLQVDSETQLANSVRLRCGNIYQELDLPLRAIEVFGKVKGSGEVDLRVSLEIARCTYALGRLEDATEQFRSLSVRAMRVGDTDIAHKAMVGQADALFEQMRYAESIHLYVKVSEEMSEGKDRDHVLSRLGSAYEHVGKPTAALLTYDGRQVK